MGAQKNRGIQRKIINKNLARPNFTQNLDEILKIYLVWPYKWNGDGYLEEDNPSNNRQQAQVFSACINAGVGPGPDMLLTLFASKDFLLCFITWILMFYTGFQHKIVNIFLLIIFSIIMFWVLKRDGSFEYPQHMFW